MQVAQPVEAGHRQLARLDAAGGGGAVSRAGADGQPMGGDRQGAAGED